MNQLARTYLTSNDGSVTRFQGTESSFFLIESQSSLAFVTVWTVARKAVVGQNRSNIAIKVDTIGRGGIRRDHGREAQRMEVNGAPCGKSDRQGNPYGVLLHFGGK